MAYSSWGNKYIKVSVNMASGVAYVFRDFAISAEIEKTGAPDLPSAKVEITGLKLETMQQLTSLAFHKNTRQNNILIVEAGYEPDNMAKIFQGEITNAHADFNSVPDVAFIIESKSGSYPSVTPQSPISVTGNQPAAEIISQLAGEMNYNFENNGVTASVQNCVINGSPVEKIKTVANMVNADLIIDDNTVVIMPRGEPRTGKGGFTLNKDNGLIGYPNFTEEGIEVVCFFNPNLAIGSVINLESIVPKATGAWKITELSHSLKVNNSSESSWRSSFSAVYNE